MKKKILSWTMALLTVWGVLLESQGSLAEKPGASINSQKTPVQGGRDEAVSSLKVVYPPPNHETVSDRIFFIGTAPKAGQVTINGKPIGDRSPAGHFAPSLPLQAGINTFTVAYQAQTLTFKITRTSTAAPTQFGFVPKSLMPAMDRIRLPLEPMCFSAIAPVKAQVTVRIGSRRLALQPQRLSLPPNSGALTGDNEPPQTETGEYQGCTAFRSAGLMGKPIFELSQGSKRITETGSGSVTILSPEQITSIEVTAEQGVARTGPSTDFSRLTPLPKGTQARVTGHEGEWLRLDYGGWIKASEVRSLPEGVLPQSLIRSVRLKTLADRTEVRFPLQFPVPVSVAQSDRTFTLTLHNTIAQTDTILQNRDAIVERLDWQQVTPTQIQYRFRLRSEQQWGYKLRYEGTTLVLTLRHPPKLGGGTLMYGNPLRPTGRVILKGALAGVKILIDPGHGSANDLGSVGPTGYPEKDVALTVSQKLAQELEKIGATVILTRKGDEDLYPQDRVKQIESLEPTLAISIHYNSLPDHGDALRSSGIGAFWYHGQSHGFAQFMHDYLVENLNRPSYGVFWNNLALTRPAIAPSVLLELGFMINPLEFEWITDPKAQQQLVQSLARGITTWLIQTRS
jgi:N-acetylmuramoyl-L-alanine amidase